MLPGMDGSDCKVEMDSVARKGLPKLRQIQILLPGSDYS